MAARNYYWQDNIGRSCYPAFAYDKAGTKRCEDFISFSEDGNFVVWRYHVLDLHELCPPDTNYGIEALKRILALRKNYIPDEFLDFTSVPGNEIPVLTFTIKVNKLTGKRKTSYEKAKVVLLDIKSRFEVNCSLYNGEDSVLKSAIEHDPSLSKLLQPANIDRAIENLLKQLQLEAMKYVGRKFLERPGFLPIWTHQHIGGQIKDSESYDSIDGWENDRVIKIVSVSHPKRSAKGYLNSRLFLDLMEEKEPSSFDFAPYLAWEKKHNDVEAKRKYITKIIYENSPTIEELRDLFERRVGSEVFRKLYYKKGFASNMISFSTSFENEYLATEVAFIKIRSFQFNDGDCLAQVNLMLKNGEVLRTPPTIYRKTREGLVRDLQAASFWDSYFKNTDFTSHYWRNPSFERTLDEEIAKRKVKPVSLTEVPDSFLEKTRNGHSSQDRFYG